MSGHPAFNINTILVTGASGRIGRAIAASLQKDFKVIGVDIVAGLYTTHMMDIRDKKIISLLEEVDAVIHTAALHAPHVGIYQDQQFWDINVHGTENLLNGCLLNNVSRFILTSSTSVYGNALVHPEQAIWVTEELEPQPRDVYDETKLAAEKLCLEAANRNLTCFCLRISRCFPEDERRMAYYRLYRGVDIEDVILGHKLALTSSLQGFEIMNISSQTPFALNDVGNLYVRADEVICKYYPDIKDIFESLSWELPKTIDRVYIIEKAKKLLNFQPCHNFIDFLTPFIEKKTGKRR